MGSKDESSPDSIQNENAVALDPETWKNWNDQLADRFSSVASVAPHREIRVGILSPLQESESDFSVTAVLSKQDGRVKIATVQWKKEPFDSWWPQQSQKLSDQVATAPALFGNPMLPSSPCADDTWTPVSYYLPGNRGYHTAVWTGSLMVVWGGQDASSAIEQRRPLRSLDRYMVTYFHHRSSGSAAFTHGRVDRNRDDRLGRQHEYFAPRHRRPVQSIHRYVVATPTGSPQRDGITPPSGQEARWWSGAGMMGRCRARAAGTIPPATHGQQPPQSGRLQHGTITQPSGQEAG